MLLLIDRLMFQEGSLNISPRLSVGSAFCYMISVRFLKHFILGAGFTYKLIELYAQSRAALYAINMFKLII